MRVPAAQHVMGDVATITTPARFLNNTLIRITMAKMRGHHGDGAVAVPAYAWYDSHARFTYILVPTGDPAKYGGPYVA